MGKAKRSPTLKVVLKYSLDFDSTESAMDYATFCLVRLGYGVRLEIKPSERKTIVHVFDSPSDPYPAAPIPGNDY